MKEEVDSNDDAIERAMYDNYIYLMLVGGLYIPPKLRKNWKLATLWCICVPFSCCFQCFHQAICLIYTCYLSLGDMSIFSESFHFAVMLGVMPLIILNALYYRKNLDFLLRSFGSGVFSYADSIDSDMEEDIRKLRAKRRRMKKNVILFIVSGYLAGGFIHFGLRPFYEWFSGKWDIVREDGLIVQSQLTYWYPIKPDTWWGCLIFYTNLYLTNYVVLACVIGSDIGFLALVDELCTEFLILNLTMKNLATRARYLYSRRYGGKLPVNDNLMNKCFKDCLFKCIQHHQALLELSQHLYDFTCNILLFVNISSSIIICLSGVIFTLDSITYTVKFTFSTFLILEIGHVFLYCWYGDRITRLSQGVGDSLYFGGWEGGTGKGLAKEVCTVNARCLSPVKLSAGGFAYISLDTFTNVINSSYSYFNLLQLLKE